MKTFLPIGSVVLLKDSTKRVMITGVLQQETDTEKVWDYSGCLYPEGIINPNRLYLFDRHQIQQLFFIGFQDAEGISFLTRLNALDSEEKEEEKLEAEVEQIF